MTGMGWGIIGGKGILLFFFSYDETENYHAPQESHDFPQLGTGMK
jgi:hypothetical protein